MLITTMKDYKFVSGPGLLLHPAGRGASGGFGDGLPGRNRRCLSDHDHFGDRHHPLLLQVLPVLQEETGQEDQGEERGERKE